MLDIAHRALIHHRTSVRSNDCSTLGVEMAAVGVVPQAGPVRLTRRGRIVILAALLVIAGVPVVLAAAPGEAAAPAGPAPTTVVRPGDTLWSVAGRYAPGRDRFLVIDEIRRLNGITDYTVHPGQRLVLPRVR
jgi:LysM repeat protein